MVDGVEAIPKDTCAVVISCAPSANAALIPKDVRAETADSCSKLAISILVRPLATGVSVARTNRGRRASRGLIRARWQRHAHAAIVKRTMHAQIALTTEVVTTSAPAMPDARADVELSRSRGGGGAGDPGGTGDD